MTKQRRVRIIVDSTCDASSEVKARLRIVPLCVRFGEDEYVDGVTITHREFYYMLATRNEMPSTSQPNPAAFAKVYDEACGGVNFDFPVLLGYTGQKSDQLTSWISATPKLWQGRSGTLRASAIGSVVGTHAGPGAVAVAFVEKE